MATLTRREILQEDINYDDAGANSEVMLTRPDGSQFVGHKVNAGALPILAALQTKMGVTNVNDALNQNFDNIAEALKDASTTQKGRVQLATNAETIAGTLATKANTPAGLAALTSTAARRGLVELATVAEAEAGTDTERAVTPEGLHAGINDVLDDRDYGTIVEKCPKVSAAATDTTITVQNYGAMLDDTNEYFYRVGSAITKDLTTLWVEGSANGGIANNADVDVLANRGMWLFVIYNKDTDVVDAILDDNAAGINISATVGVDWVKRLIGMVYAYGADLASNQIVDDCVIQGGFTQYNDYIHESSGDFGAGVEIEVDIPYLEPCFEMRGTVGTTYAIATSESVSLSYINRAGLKYFVSGAFDSQFSIAPFTVSPDQVTFSVLLIPGGASASKFWTIQVTQVDFFNR